MTAPDSPDSALECAVALLEVIPTLMGALRCEVRHDPGITLTMPQFRALALLERIKPVFVSQIAEHLGLGLPATSKIVDALVMTGAINRKPDPGDRRRVLLEISAAGEDALRSTRLAAQRQLAKLLTPLPLSDRIRLKDAMNALGLILPKLTPGICP